MLLLVLILVRLRLAQCSCRNGVHPFSISVSTPTPASTASTSANTPTRRRMYTLTQVIPHSHVTGHACVRYNIFTPPPLSRPHGSRLAKDGKGRGTPAPPRESLLYDEEPTSITRSTTTTSLPTPTPRLYDLPTFYIAYGAPLVRWRYSDWM
ncbi:hypothetical protein K439DRAFT_488647 [Ramaria rubella]|nr:hypothetical protein K439DRAFT_488647 [Ramaria rubella]